MISVIICSKGSAFCSAIKENIERTIGLVHEVIVIDNSLNNLNISQAYNKGASMAQNPFLCFVHEDVVFHTYGWGNKVVNHFNADPSIGLIGIAGSPYKSAAPSSWYPNENVNEFVPVFKYLKQHYNDKPTQIECQNPAKELRSKVVVMDGVWMCCKQALWRKIKFDESLIKGFHGYDIDFSISAHKYVDLAIVYDILIEHFSPGSYRTDWLSATLRLHEKWKWVLPLNILDVNEKIIFKHENEWRAYFLRRMYAGGHTPLKILTVIWGVGTFRFFNAVKFSIQSPEFK